MLAKMTKKTALIVLGMHRSGTSSVAGALALAGAAAPKHLMPAAADNPKGFWESSAVADFNDRILNREGSNWHDWRAIPRAPLLADKSALNDAIELLRDEFGDAAVIVLKDPRICRIFPLWRQALLEAGYNPLVVSPVRAPSEVAASLESRNALSRNHALRLWMRHVLDAEQSSRGLDRRFVLWPDFLHQWRTVFDAINKLSATTLNLDDARSSEIDAFLSTDLRRQSDASPPPSAVARTYGLLAQLSRHGEHSDLHFALDDLRSDFDQACDLFSDAPR